MDPVTTIVRRDLSLTYAEFSLAIQRSKMIGLKVLPPLAVSQENAKFQRIDVEHYQHGRDGGTPEDTRRNADGTYARDEGRWTEDSYNVEEHGVEERVDFAKVERWGDLIRIENNATVRAIDRLLVRLEYDVAQAVFNTTTWTGSALTTASSNPWTDTTNGTPLADIDAASDKTKTSCGMRANKLVTSFKAYRALLRHPDITDLIKHDGVQILLNALQGVSGDSAAVSQVSNSLLNLLQLEEILVGDAAFNSADKGQTPLFTDFWDTTMAMVCRIEDDGFMGDISMARPHIGRMLFSTKNNEPVPGDMMAGEDSLIIEEYEDNPSRGKYIRPRNKRQAKIMHAQCGHLLTAVTA